MARSAEELKKLAIAAIDRHADEIKALGDSIYSEPELGYKEFKTAAKFTSFLDRLGVSYKDKVGITGVIAPFKGKESKVRVAVMGELDAVVVPGHVAADPVTGAAHCCGHHAMIAGIAGVACALADTDIMDDLSGDVVVMAVLPRNMSRSNTATSLKTRARYPFWAANRNLLPWVSWTTST